MLGAVKTEFGKFGDVLARVAADPDRAEHLGRGADTRTNVMNRAAPCRGAADAEANRKLLPGTPTTPTAPTAGGRRG